jgi:FixJ family two-component response regulator
MSGDIPGNKSTGLLVYDSQLDRLLLDGQVLEEGASVEIHVFDAWISGLIERDAGGWYLITRDQVGIRLHTGLLARMDEEAVAVPADLQVSQELLPRVLIVDDDRALLRALPRTILLRLPNVQVDTAESASVALEMLQQQKYDAMVCDIKMPEIDGLELLEKSHQHQPEMPTLLITGHGEHDLAIRALRGGAYDYIQKPIERENFIAALLRAIQTCQLRRRVADQQRTLELHARSLERLVQQRTQELIEAYAAKDKVVNIVSHELTGPIVHLKRIIGLLQKKLEQVEEMEIVKHSFADIEQSLIRTEELVQDLQDTTMSETRLFIPRPQRCDLIIFCHGILQEIADTGIADLSWEVSDQTIFVEVDCDQVAQTLRTLLVQTNAQSSPDVPVTVTFQCTASEAIIAVRDLGAQTHLRGGFYIARKILEQHDGRLEMQNFPGNRRTLFISLPLPSSQSQTDQDCQSSLPVICATATLRYHGQTVSDEPEQNYAS